MQLLGLLYYQSEAEAGEPKLANLVPRLYPFFPHTLLSVRLASVSCLSSLLSKFSSPAAWLTPEVLAPAIRLTFQNLVLESHQPLLEKSKAWQSLQL